MKRSIVALLASVLLFGSQALASRPSAPTTSLPDDPARVATQFAELRIASFDANSVPTFLAGRLGKLGPGSPEAAGLAYFHRLAPLFRATGREELAAESVSTDDLGQVHVRYQQYVNGLPVVGAEIIVHADARTGEVRAINGHFAPDNDLPRHASLSSQDAVASALDEAGLTTGQVAGDPELVYLRTDSGKTFLAWSFYVSYQDDLGDELDRVFADAVNGGLVTRWGMIKRALNRKIYNGNHTDPNNPTLPGTLMFGEGTSSNSDAAAWSCYVNFGYTYNYYKTKFNRDSFDNAGSSLIGTVHVGTNWVNAYWNGSQMVFGDGDGTTATYLSGALDVVAHELTHAVTDRTANLAYQKESGALNEAMSDILGSSVEAYRDGGVNSNTWKLGEEVWTPGTAGDALRYMNDPAADGQSADYYPTRNYSGTCTPSSSNDYCGVHTNSGIANLAYYLAVAGGTHPRGKTSVQVPAIGISKAEQIFYRALTVYMTSSTTFEGARNATAQAAQDLYGATEVGAVQAAWNAVGVPGGPVSITTLSNGQTVSNLSGSTGTWQYFKITVPSGQTSLQIAMSGGSGDGDLYVKLGAQPSSSSYDYRPYLNGNSETVNVTNPAAGDWYIGINAYATYSGVSLTATYAGGSGGGGGGGTGVTVLTNGQTVTNLSGASASWQYFKISVPSGQSSLSIAMSGGSGDADLYVKLGAQPSSSTYDYRPYLSGNNETVNVSNPAAGDWYIGISGYAAFSGVSLTASYAGSGGGGGGGTTTSEVEPNGSRSSANVISTSGTDVQGYISSSSDSDYFKITLPGNGTLTVDLVVPSSNDYDVKVYNSSGTQLASGTNGTGQAEHVTYTNTSSSSRVIYVRVYGYSGSMNTTTPYTLTLTW